ncbi:DUF6127 family protein [Sphingomonas glaciei]|uniref:DUF6127 family protein n=1 Tax=Sphingomonas glaciei TaxID=2938948 RepID=A0ABY5MXK0_9SPHN|nr:DUF6127 family protein [Sphingomonas glaciei]UUR09178.1 DUF6127 family protein [Sphingomonas glaciei]
MIRRDSDELLAQLIASAEGQPVNFVILQAMVEEASNAGACRALTSLGLEDKTARRDMDELRELLGAWRDVKKSAWQTVARWLVRICLAGLMVVIAYQSSLRDLLRN